MEQYVIYEQAILELKGLLYEAIDELEDTGSNDELLNKLRRVASVPWIAVCKVKKINDLP